MGKVSSIGSFHSAVCSCRQDLTRKWCGAIAIYVPEVLGVGYEATNRALSHQLTLTTLFLLLFAKTLATAITLASRFGGGVFSPSLYIGAMAGGAYGLMAGNVFPELASSEGLYAILGMGAVAGVTAYAAYNALTQTEEEAKALETAANALLNEEDGARGGELHQQGHAEQHWGTQAQHGQ